MITWWTADWHLDHEGIIDMMNLPFKSIEEWNDYVINTVNRWVKYQDRIFVLGDVAWRTVDSFLDRITCKNIHLIVGNHDKANFSKKFKTSCDVCMVSTGGGSDVWCSHYPHAYWPKSHYGSYHAYGHMHAEREETLDQCFPGRRSIDVSVYNAKRLLGDYRPFNMSDIINNTGKGHDPVEYYKDRQRLRGQPRLHVRGDTPDSTRPES